MNLIIFGPPGAGKGTQAEFISNSFGAVHISTGDMLREAVRNRTETGLLAKKYMDAGDLVPDEVVIEIIRQKIEGLAGVGFLLDGFPRNVEQALSLDNILERSGIVIDAVVSLEVDNTEVVDRLLGRAEIESRSDDSEEVIRQRLDVYEQQTLPLAAYYTERGVFWNIEGMGTVEEVRDRINSVLSSLNKG